MKIEKWISININKDNFYNKNVFITGGNSGIGFELAKHVASLGSNLFLLCRNTSKAENAKTELLKQFPNIKINLIKLDLASFKSIKEASEEIKKIDVDMFINNAGVYHLPYSKTEDNLEITMGTNFIGTFYLNSMLLDYFSSLNKPIHILFESSFTSNYSKNDFDDFFMDKKYDKFKIYSRSKLATNNMYDYFVKKYASNSNLIFDITHPGGTYTPLIAKGYKNKVFHSLASGFMKLVLHSPEKASLTMLYALNQSTNFMVGPKHFFQLSGFPKQVKFKIEKDSVKCIEIAKNKIKEIEGNL